MIALLALSLQAAAPAPPPGLVFGYYRMLAFRSRARSSGCGTGDLDGELNATVKALGKRYGKKAFEAPKVPASPPGDCGVIRDVYRVNLADFRRDAAAALAAPVPTP